MTIPRSYTPHACSPNSRGLSPRLTSSNHCQLPFPHRYAIGPAETNRYEVDFLLPHNDLVIPIEAKAENNISSSSLKAIKRLQGEDFPLCVRYSLQNLKLDGDILNIPLFMADWSERLINLALEHVLQVGIKINGEDSVQVLLTPSKNSCG